MLDVTARARRGLTLYLVLVLAGTGVFQALLFRAGDAIDKHIGLVLGMMWTPGLASIVTRLVLREGFSDISLRFGGRAGARASAIAWIYPLIVGLLAYGVAWLTGLEHLGVPPARLAKRIFLTLTIGVPLSAISAAGEELGWRGYMLTRLFEAQIPRPVLVSGLLWGLWHVPLILSGQYASGPYPLLSAVVFVAAILPETYVHAYARLSSGSVWPAVIAHATWNSVIQGAFDPSTAGGSSTHSTSIWIGESGLLVILAGTATAFALLPRSWPLKRTPTTPLASTELLTTRDPRRERI